MLLLPPMVLAEEPPSQPWIAARAEYRVAFRPDQALADLTVTYHFQPLVPGWSEVRLVGGALVPLRVDGPVSSVDGALLVTLSPGTTERTVTVVGTVDTSSGAFSLPVYPAAVQQVVVEAPGSDVLVDGEIDGVLRASSVLNVRTVPTRTGPPPNQPPLARADVGSAFWEEDGELISRTRIRFVVMRGQRSSFAVQLPSDMAELQVQGNALASWKQEGSTLRLEAKEAVKGAFEVLIEGRGPLPMGEFRAPVPQPLDVRRVEQWHTLGKSSEIELVPSAGRTVSGRVVPEWVTGLLQTAPLAWWQGGVPTLRVERFAPDRGPDTVIERAEYLAVANQDGVVLLRSTFYVRNERSQYLHLRPSPGFVPMTARRGSAAMSLLSDGEGGVYVTLERSLETVQGMLALPVEVTWIGRGVAWEETKKGSYDLVFPAANAPVEQAVWEVHLPRGFQPRQPSAPGATAIWDPEREQAQDAFRQAVDAYRRNDFEQAEVWLHQVEVLSGEDDNANRLRSNIDLLLDNTISSSNSGKDDAQARRVREMANARSFDLRDQQVESEKKANEALKRGDYDTAERELENVTRSAEILQRMEQAGSEEQRAVYGSASSALVEVKKAKAKKQEEEEVAMEPPPPQLIVVTESELMIADDWDAPPMDAVAEAPGFLDGEGDMEEPDVVTTIMTELAIGDVGVVEEEPITADEDDAGVFDGVEEGGISGLVEGVLSGTVGGTVTGAGGLGMRGTGMGGGGAAEGAGAGFGARQKESDDRGGRVRSDDKPTVTYKDSTEIDFESLSISGELLQPDGVLVRDGKEAEQPSPIEERLYYVPNQPVASPDMPAPAPAPAPGPVARAPTTAAASQEYFRRVPTDGRSSSEAAPATSEPYGGEKLDANQPHTGSADGDDDLRVAEDIVDEVRVVSGRSYQTVVQSAAGVTRRGAAPAAPKSSPPPAIVVEDSQPELDYATATRGRSATPAKPKASATSPSANGAPARGPAPAKGQPPGTPPVQRTVAFAQTPTPVTLALPLDTPAFYATQALLKAGEYPSITFTYRTEAKK